MAAAFKKRWLSWAAAGCCCAAVWNGHTGHAVSTSTARSARSATANLTPWELAERGREALEAIPEESRTKADYATTMDGFRAIYHANPGNIHAPSAIYAVAELLEEEGRSLHDSKSLKAALGQYEFLRTQYPGSSLRVMALLAEAQIAANDLGDIALAKERYRLFLKSYPASSHAEEARAGLDALGKGSAPKVQGPASKSAKSSPVLDTSKVSKSAPAPENVVPSDPAAGKSSLGATPITRGPAVPSGSTASSAADDAGSERMGISSPVDPELDNTAAGPEGLAPATRAPGSAKVADPTTRRRGGLAQVTGIRHWSTPTYTRVAIDLGDNVTYEAARVPNPDRIYFDLHGTRLAQELVGKSFTVTDDGFLRKIRVAQFSNDMTRVVLDVNDVTEYSAFLLPNPYRLIVDIHGGKNDLGKATKADVPPADTAPGAVTAPAADIPAPRVAPTVKSTSTKPVPNTVSTKSTNATEIASLSAEPGKVEATSMPTSRPIAAKVQDDKDDYDAPAATSATQAGVVASASTAAAISTKKIRKGKAADGNAAPAKAADRTADGQTSLVRALGLKVGRIVIDAGHGGHDSGTIGVDGIQEKDVVLDVALRVGKLLHDRLGAEVIYTRADDTFIPLETRTAIANKAQADLFLSIHANSSPDASARGVETYYLNFTTSPDALETAARENAVSDQSIHQLSELVKKIALKDKISESREFASDVESSLYGGLQRGNVGLKDRGVKKAPFVVLIGANMPSILAEISFVTNPRDANQLQQPDYRQRVAESLYKGVSKYAGGLSTTKPTTERASAQ
jgi:N-acetylmuramoyl-L-alanine amidase